MRHDDCAFGLLAFFKAGWQGYDRRDLQAVACRIVDELRLAEILYVDPRTLGSDDGDLGLVDQQEVSGRHVGGADRKEDAIAICRIVADSHILAREGRIQTILGDSAPTDSWALVFDPEVTGKLAAGGCGIAMLDSGEEMVRAAMAYIGLDPNSNNADDIKKGGEVIKAVRPNITYFHSSRYIGDLANGDLCVAAGYSGDILQAAARAEEAANGNVIRYTIPKEGAVLWFDMMTIPAGAPNVENAHKLMNFLMRPEIIADVTNYVWYANPNKAADEFVDPEILSDTSIYPTEEVLKKLYVMEGRPQDAQRLMTRTWTSVKSGR